MKKIIDVQEINRQIKRDRIRKRLFFFVCALILVNEIIFHPRSADALEILVYATQPVKSRPDVYVMTSFEADSEVDEPKNGFLTKVFSTNYPQIIFEQRRDYDDFPDVHHDWLVQQIAKRYEETGQFMRPHEKTKQKKKWGFKKSVTVMPIIKEVDEKNDE